MKVTVTIPLDIDRESWTINYGVEGAAAVRADVKAYVAIVVEEYLRDRGLLTEPVSS